MNDLDDLRARFDDANMTPRFQRFGRRADLALELDRHARRRRHGLLDRRRCAHDVALCVRDLGGGAVCAIDDSIGRVERCGVHSVELALAPVAAAVQPLAGGDGAQKCPAGHEDVVNHKDAIRIGVEHLMCARGHVV